MSPSRLFRGVAVAEAVTWALLLLGMVLKYSGVTDVAVRVFGMAHGVVFIGYCLTTLLLAVDRRWTRGHTLLGLVASVPPFATVLLERYAERRGLLAPAWRLAHEAPHGIRERAAAWVLRNPLRGTVAALFAVLALTGVALLAGPPAG